MLDFLVLLPGIQRLFLWLCCGGIAFLYNYLPSEGPIGKPALQMLGEVGPLGFDKFLTDNVVAGNEDAGRPRHFWYSRFEVIGSRMVVIGPEPCGKSRPSGQQFGLC